MKNIDKIGEGVINDTLMKNGKLPTDEFQEILRRRDICNGCPFFSENAKVNPAINYKTDRKDKHCTQCGCPIDIRTASLSANCGIENFNHNNPDKQIPLKWVAYQKPNADNE